MAREEEDPEDARATRSSRRTVQPTSRLSSGESGHTVVSDRNWRPDRAGRRRKAVSFPTSRSEFVLWLQYGGWRVVTIAVAAVVVLFFVLVLFGMLRRGADTSNIVPTPDTGSAMVGDTFPRQATVTPAISPTDDIAAQGVGGSAAIGASFRVTGTGSEGLFLRPDHSSDNQPLKTIPDGSVVTVAGEDYSGPDRVWKNIRDADGAVGWVAAEFLQPVP